MYVSDKTFVRMSTAELLWVVLGCTAAGDRLYLHLRDAEVLIGGELSNAAWIAPDLLMRMQVWLNHRHGKLQHYTVCPTQIIALYWWDASQETWRTPGGKP